MERTQPQGFSLIEILCALTIIALTASWAVPSLGILLDKNRSRGIRDSLIADLQFARSHAITHLTPIELCGSSDGRTCDQQWSKGWLIRRNNTAQVIRSVQLSGNGQPLSWGRPSQNIRYMPDGTAPTSNSRFHYCESDRPLTSSWQIVINRQGRGRVVNTPTDPDCAATTHP